MLEMDQVEKAQETGLYLVQHSGYKGHACLFVLMEKYESNWRRI